ncbi:hypothetical protein [Bombella saccharophila]|uniref:Uncharacterized protein n=1 Tax=Bombella saccharophila TaxID=2967338 RepID=A0ABT3W8U6_9PROT|nr:hypothetical protein [Bombella saccharophila]MCX5615233.1 hypothetical protein [Bombella saccharophila]
MVKSFTIFCLLLCFVYKSEEEEYFFSTINLLLFISFYLFDYVKVIFRYGLTFPISWVVLGATADGGGFSEKKLEDVTDIAGIFFVIIYVYIFFFLRKNRKYISKSKIIEYIIMIIDYVFLAYPKHIRWF